jgi:hypothetical protein
VNLKKKGKRMNGRDLDYEEANRTFDWRTYTEGYKCKNYDLCKVVLPKWWFECKGCYLCNNCDMMWGELPFRKAVDECSVCFGTEHKQVEFPAECGHWFCTECTKSILWKDDANYYLSPVPYGCPPCPNRCSNPERGKQCECSVYMDEVVEQWKIDHTAQYEEWIRNESVSIEIGETDQGSIVGSGTCPLCRTKWRHAASKA